MIALGGMGEWLKPTDLKSVKAARSSGVRIPLPPPAFLIKCLSELSANNLQKEACSGQAWRIKILKDKIKWNSRIK